MSSNLNSMDNILDEKDKEPSPTTRLLQKIKYIATSLCLVFICYGDSPPTKNEGNTDIIQPTTPDRLMIVDRDTIPEMRDFDWPNEPAQELEKLAKEKE